MNLSVSPEVLALLVCPVSGHRLRLATRDELARFADGTLPEGALVTEDASAAYPIRDGFPIVVESERLSLPST